MHHIFIISGCILLHLGSYKYTVMKVICTCRLLYWFCLAMDVQWQHQGRARGAFGPQSFVFRPFAPPSLSVINKKILVQSGQKWWLLRVLPLKNLSPFCPPPTQFKKKWRWRRHCWSRALLTRLKYAIYRKLNHVLSWRWLSVYTPVTRSVGFSTFYRSF